jgi:hypothetical protein
MIPLVSHVCSPLIEKLKEWSLFWVNSGDSLILDPQVGRRHCQGLPVPPEYRPPAASAIIVMRSGHVDRIGCGLDLTGGERPPALFTMKRERHLVVGTFVCQPAEVLTLSPLLTPAPQSDHHWE